MKLGQANRIGAQSLALRLLLSGLSCPCERPCHRAGLEQTEALEKVVLSSWTYSNGSSSTRPTAVNSGKSVPAVTPVKKYFRE
ncbi:hypothetical protein AAFF_G00386610 [Aldrovandia affinis]|uniref:Secreted protein n=1 Tax=Aldrovandia affinis TaxID=143900 RepID=A0AAD7R3U3_9TELE|nr:hypothetical protein AAFF_G00395320 [Aldrovandia affinis]KAJ8362269.1 hypothetical protein AAFF_G00386610 [Aldrovandia affinis]